MKEFITIRNGLLGNGANVLINLRRVDSIHLMRDKTLQMLRLYSGGGFTDLYFGQLEPGETGEQTLKRILSVMELIAEFWGTQK